MTISERIRNAALYRKPSRPGLISCWGNVASDAVYAWEVGREACSGFPRCATAGDDITPRTFLLLVACALETK